MKPTWLVPAPTRARLVEYLAALRSGEAEAGRYLRQALGAASPADMEDDDLLARLVDTKLPRIFAESAVTGDGSDWNPIELGLLGDLSVAVPVTVFDNGAHRDPLVHAMPFAATLVFTPGALLRHGRCGTPADWEAVTTDSGELDPEGYYRLYERRLLPVFTHIDAYAGALGKRALVTVPGLGCGQFAGPFAGRLGAALRNALARFLETHGGRFRGVRVVYFDPYNECANEDLEIHGIAFRVRPLLDGNEGKSQLCLPSAYADAGEDFGECALISIVAWDHVSWPGNDFWGGSRCTDDGVKAAATDVMFRLTGVEGRYDEAARIYRPPPPYRVWEEVVDSRKLRLSGLL